MHLCFVFNLQKINKIFLYLSAVELAKDFLKLFCSFDLFFDVVIALTLGKLAKLHEYYLGENLPGLINLYS